MSPALVTVEVIVGALLLLLTLAVVFIIVRRRVIAGGLPLLVCALRTADQPRWRLGLVRLTDDHFEWFTVVGPRFAPTRSWRRHQLDLGAPAPLPDAVPGLPHDAVHVQGTCGPDPCALAFSPAVCTAMRAWLESSPPGFNVNVT